VCGIGCNWFRVAPHPFPRDLSDHWDVFNREFEKPVGEFDQKLHFISDRTLLRAYQM